MTRPLLTLVAGVLVAIGGAVLLTGGAGVPPGFGLVVLTILAGAVVMAVVGRRASLRRRAEQLRDTDHLRDSDGRDDGARIASTTTTERTDRE